MEDFYQILDVLHYPEEKVIATIVGVNGSAYKKEGSSMLFFSDGTQIGMLTAGCLEEDLAVKVREVFHKQEAAIIQYDLYTEDDLDWGNGAGCNGTIDILLEPVTEQLTEDLHMVKELLLQQKPVIVLKKLVDLGEYVFIEEDGEPFGNWSGSLPTIEFTSKSGIITRDGSSIFQQTIYPKPRLIVFGAGPDARPLVALAAETGFTVLVCDWREALCQKKLFPAAALVIQGFPQDLLKQISFSPYDFVVIMTHQFKRDQELVRRILHENIRYLGVLGPKERTKRLLNGKEIPRGVFSPMGTSIGAKGPVEIAVSIVAQMIQVWRKPAHERVELLWTIPD